MTRTEFEEKSFEDVMSQLNEELDEITTLDTPIPLTEKTDVEHLIND